MALPYISPAQMDGYRQRLRLFAKNADYVECIRSHYFPDSTATCDLTGKKEQDEIFVLQNRAGDTLKVCAGAMQIVANVLDIRGADAWYQHLKEQRKASREKAVLDAARKEEEKKSASRAVLIRRRSPNRPFDPEKIS